MRTLIVSASQGVFLDTCFGGLIFSRQSSVWSREARAFVDVLDAKRFIAQVHDAKDEAWRFPSDLSFVYVATTREHATMDECEAAGQAAWVVREGRPFTLDGLGHTMTLGKVGSGKTVNVLAVMAALKHERPM